MNRRVLYIFLGILAFFAVLCVGAVMGGALTLFALQTRPIQALTGLKIDTGREAGSLPLDRLPHAEMPVPFRGESFQGELFQGALLTEVVEGSPADEAGLEIRDRILAVDGKEVGLERSLSDLIAEYQPGDSVTLQVEQPGEGEREVTVQLGEHPEDPQRAYLGVSFMPGASFDGSMVVPGEPFRLPMFREGLEVLPELPEGVQQAAIIGRIEPGSPAESAGLEENDLIVSIDGEPVEDVQMLREAVESSQPEDTITLEVIRTSEEEPRTVEVTLREDPQEAGKAYLGVRIYGFIKIDQDDENSPSFNFKIPFVEKLWEPKMPGEGL